MILLYQIYLILLSLCKYKFCYNSQYFNLFEIFFFHLINIFYFKKFKYFLEAKRKTTDEKIWGLATKICTLAQQQTSISECDSPT
jgi:hypothetical protein